ncbi:MAG TPA: hypothetical protein DCM02_12425 [Flavobacterium sp.]|nr:hypothetical protein [Flavobacterium sp.]
MIKLDLIKKYFPLPIQENPLHSQYIVKEYLQLLILDYLSNTSFVKKITFIGGTNLRLVKGIDRFSEDLDFDCKNLSEQEFNTMTDSVLQFLIRNGYAVETRDKVNPNLSAFRRNLYFPKLLFDLGITGHKDQRFLIKMESEDQHIDYASVIAYIKGCGFHFPFPVPSDSVLCAMKISAMLSRQKGRDFYDVLFLLGQSTPDYDFLKKKCGIRNHVQLKEAIGVMLQNVDLSIKKKDVEHLLFNKNNSSKIQYFNDFVKDML